MTGNEQDTAVLVLICEKSKTSQFSTEALIGLVIFYNHQVLYRIVASKAHRLTSLLDKGF